MKPSTWLDTLYKRFLRVRQPQPKPKTEYGLQIGVNLGYGLWQDAAKLDQIGALGVTWVRLSLAWDWIEPSKGDYDWTAFLGLVDALNNRNISVLLTTNNVVNPAYVDPSLPGRHPPTTPAEIADYAKFHGIASKMLGSRSVMYEIGNEVASDYGGPNRGPNYTSVAKAAAAEIRANYSGKNRPCTIVGPAVTPDWAAFIYECLPAGLFPSLDGCSVHPYGYGQPNWRPLSQLSSDYDSIRATIAPYANTPLYSSEWGYSTVGDVNLDSFTETSQAQAIVNMWNADRAARIPLSIYYEYADDPNTPNPHERGFGLVDKNFVPKPSYYAAQTFLRAGAP